MARSALDWERQPVGPSRDGEEHPLASARVQRGSGRRMMTAPITGETWGDQIDPVRTHLLQASEQPFAVLRPKLAEAHEALVAALANVSERQAQFTPAVGDGE